MRRLRQSQFVPPVPLILATELGFLEGVDVTTSRTPGSADQLRTLLAGEVDAVVTAIDNLFEWTKAGASLALVAQLESTTRLSVFAQPGVTSLADLHERRFAVDALANGFALVARRLLGAAGVVVDFVEVGGVRERFDALIAGDAEATLLGPPLDHLAEAAGMSRLLDINEIFAAFPGQGLVVRADLVDAPELVGYLAALDRAVIAGESMTDADGIALLEKHGFSSAASAAWSARPHTLEVSAAGLAFVTDIRRELDLIPQGIELSDLLDPEPLRRATVSVVPGER